LLSHRPGSPALLQDLGGAAAAVPLGDLAARRPLDHGQQAVGDALCHAGTNRAARTLFPTAGRRPREPVTANRILPRQEGSPAGRLSRAAPTAPGAAGRFWRAALGEVLWCRGNSCRGRAGVLSPGHADTAARGTLP